MRDKSSIEEVDQQQDTDKNLLHGNKVDGIFD